MRLPAAIIGLGVFAAAFPLSTHMPAAYAKGEALQCVRYVKVKKPEYEKKYARSTRGDKAWVPAKDLWDFVDDKGQEARVGSVMVLDSWKGNEYGHVAIVTAVDGDKITVTQSNWPEGTGESTHTFIRSGSTVKSQGGSKTYPLRGFVYSPK